MLRRMLCAALLLALCLTGAALADEAALLDAYDLISPLGNGMYAVRRGGLWGIVSEAGEVALEVQLEQEPVFEDGRAVVASAAGKERLSGVDAFFGGAGDQGRCGVIDEEGRVRVPFEYDYIQIRDGVALAMRDEKYSYFDLNGDPISRESYDYADGFIGDYAKVGKSDGFALSFGVIDRAGAEVVPLEFNDIRLSEDGAAAARRSTGEKYGFIDMRGDWVIEPKFDSAEPFKNGCAAVGMESKDKSYEAWDYGIACDWGLIDAQGDEILPMAYDFVNVRDDGIIETSVFDGEMNKVRWFEISGGWAVEVDAPPEEPEPPRSEPLDNPRPAKGRAGDGALFVERRDGRWRLTDASGEPAVDEVFLNEPAFGGGCAAVSIQTGNIVEGFSNENAYEVLWGVIDEAGQIRVPIEYNSMQISEGVALAREGEAYVFLNLDGTPLSEKRYFRAEPFRDGYATVADEYELGESESVAYNALWGAIDRTGAEVVPCKYGFLEMGDGGTALVQDWNTRLSETEYYIDMTGARLFDAEYDRATPFVGGCAAVAEKVERGNTQDSEPDAYLWGAIDRQGNAVLPLEYDQVSVYEDGRILAVQDDAERWFELRDGRAVETGAP